MRACRFVSLNAVNDYTELKGPAVSQPISLSLIMVDEHPQIYNVRDKRGCRGRLHLLFLSSFGLLDLK